MACGNFTITKVPASKSQQTIDLFNRSKPKGVTKAPDGTELFKVTAEFPPCGDPASQTQERTP